MASTNILTDGIVVNNQPQSATPYGPTTLTGGLYAVTAVLGATSTIDLQVTPGPDGSTAIDVLPQIKGSVATTFYNTVYLPPGRYQVLIGTAAASIAVQRVKLN